MPKKRVFHHLLCQGRGSPRAAILDRGANGGDVKTAVLAEIGVLGSHNRAFHHRCNLVHFHPLPVDLAQALGFLPEVYRDRRIHDRIDNDPQEQQNQK